jgi:Tol biopolymer transport system component
MPRLVFLGLIALILSGCGVTDQNVPSSTTVAGQPAVQSPQPPEAAPVAPGEELTTPPASATNSPDATARARRATLATAWQQAHQGGAEATALLYFGATDDTCSFPMALWQVPLDTSISPQLVGDSPLFALRVIDAALSPDEQWIAYSTSEGDWPYELQVARIDGTNDQVISTLSNHNDCFPIFAWLRAGPTLIYSTGTIGVRAYNAATASERLAIPFDRAGSLFGIDAQDQIIMAVRRQPSQPRDIAAVDPSTGTQTVLAPMPQPAEQSLFCRKLSPDGRYIIFGMGQTPYQPYLFDTTTRQIREIEIVPDHVFWAMDSQHILTMDQVAPGGMTMRAVPDMNTVATAVLPSTGPALSELVVKSTSPDGNWLVGCPITSADQPSWLYHLPTQTWRQLSSGGTCVRVVGWITQ